MANYKGRLVIVVLGATIWSLGVVWIVFSRGVRDALAQRSTAFSLVAVCFCAASICAFYFVAKRMPRFAMGLTALAVYLVLLSIYAVASLVLEIDNVWIDGMQYLVLVLLPVSTFIMFWQGVKKTKDDKGREGKKEGS